MSISNVLFEKISGSHTDDRRTLTPWFNGSVGVFEQAAQVKIAEMKRDAVLGKHYHRYPELFTVLTGEATFTLTDRQTNEREEYVIRPGWRLVIPSGVYHEAFVQSGTMLLGATAEIYVSAEVNDLKD